SVQILYKYCTYTVQRAEKVHLFLRESAVFGVNRRHSSRAGMRVEKHPAANIFRRAKPKSKNILYFCSSNQFVNLQCRTLTTNVIA
ncbi:MAG: hypothetical protein IKR79_05390, partial [Bacteroidales bacterium]|nr:hypothetical protein [Bacteroidales bacterium]